MRHGDLLDDVILNPGEVIDGKYEIVSMLGQGAMGVVYRARARSLNRDVALKLLTHVDGDTMNRFSVEAQSLARIKHPTVVRIDNFGSSDPWGPYLVLSYIPGRDLDAVAAAGLPLEDAVSLAMELCTGVFACHTRSVIHRDLKPSNVLVTNKPAWLERVKILDLGLALPFDSPIIKARQMRMSQIGPVDGLSRYIAPELLRRERATTRCDQYGIAALTYLLATGHTPFADLEGDDLVRAIVLGKVAPPRQLRTDIPADLDGVLLKGMHPDPSMRFKSVKEQALAMVAFGPENLKKKATRYFMDMEGPIDLRLIEPVSAYRQNGNPGMPPAVAAPASVPAAPLQAPPREVRPPKPVELQRGPVFPTPPPPPMAWISEPPRPRRPTPAVASVGRKPQSKAAHSQRRSPWMESNAAILFALGSALGAAITTALFVGYILYRQSHSDPCPCLDQAPAEAAQPSGSHGAN